MPTFYTPVWLQRSAEAGDRITLNAGNTADSDPVLFDTPEEAYEYSKGYLGGETMHVISVYLNENLEF